MKKAFKSRQIVGEPKKEIRGKDSDGRKTIRWLIKRLLDERALFKLLYKHVNFDQADDSMTSAGTIPIDHFSETVDHDYRLAQPNQDIFISGIDDDENLRPPPVSRRKPN